MSLQKHLLLVDDESQFLVLTRLLLEMEGWRVTPASSGEQALALLREGCRPDVVVLDHRMPGLTGSQALARMRQEGLPVPAVLVSARHDVLQSAAAEGFDAALEKPFAVEELVLMVEGLLRERRAARAAG